MNATVPSPLPDSVISGGSSVSDEQEHATAPPSSILGAHDQSSLRISFAVDGERQSAAQSSSIYDETASESGYILRDTSKIPQKSNSEGEIPSQIDSIRNNKVKIHSQTVSSIHYQDITTSESRYNVDDEDEITCQSIVGDDESISDYFESDENVSNRNFSILNNSNSSCSDITKNISEVNSDSGHNFSLDFESPLSQNKEDILDTFPKVHKSCGNITIMKSHLKPNTKKYLSPFNSISHNDSLSSCSNEEGVNIDINLKTSFTKQIIKDSSTNLNESIQKTIDILPNKNIKILSTNEIISTKQQQNSCIKLLKSIDDISTSDLHSSEDSVGDDVSFNTNPDDILVKESNITKAKANITDKSIPRTCEINCNLNKQCNSSYSESDYPDNDFTPQHNPLKALSTTDEDTDNDFILQKFSTDKVLITTKMRKLCKTKKMKTNKIKYLRSKNFRIPCTKNKKISKNKSSSCNISDIDPHNSNVQKCSREDGLRHVQMSKIPHQNHRRSFKRNIFFKNISVAQHGISSDSEIDDIQKKLTTPQVDGADDSCHDDSDDPFSFSATFNPFVISSLPAQPSQPLLVDVLSAIRNLNASPPCPPADDDVLPTSLPCANESGPAEKSVYIPEKSGDLEVPLDHEHRSEDQADSETLSEIIDDMTNYDDNLQEFPTSCDHTDNIQSNRDIMSQSLFDVHEKMEKDEVTLQEGVEEKCGEYVKEDMEADEEFGTNIEEFKEADTEDELNDLQLDPLRRRPRPTIMPRPRSTRTICNASQASMKTLNLKNISYFLRNISSDFFEKMSTIIPLYKKFRNFKLEILVCDFYLMISNLQSNKL